MLSDELKIDPEVIVAAKRVSSFSLVDLPASLMDNRHFWMDIISRHPQFWLDIPARFQRDPSFVRNLVSFGHTSVVKGMLDQFPFLADEPRIWRNILRDHVALEILPALIRDYAPLHIRRDKNLMLLACWASYSVLQYLPASFQQDRQFLETIIESENGIHVFPKAAQRLYPDLVVKAIGNLPDRLYFGPSVVNAVAPELWTRLDVAEAWFKKARYRAFHSRFPPAVKDNREFGLVAAQHGTSQTFADSTSTALRSDKSFMKAAVGMRREHYLKTHGEALREDFDLAVLAFSGDRE